MFSRPVLLHLGRFSVHRYLRLVLSALLTLAVIATLAVSGAADIIGPL